MLEQHPQVSECKRSLNVPTLRFIVSQIRNQKLKAQGRRYSLDDKILALSIFKETGKGYRYLSKLFSLPSRRTLLSILNKIPFKCGGYLIDGIEIVHLYDCPHLMKGIHNSLLTRDLSYTLDGQTKVASWSHILELYRMDQQMGRFSQLHKLTDLHVLPQKIKKMKVKYCTQVFSPTFATAMKTRALISVELNPSSNFYLDPKAADTADLLLFFDTLYDSVNGSSSTAPPGKPLRSAVTRNLEYNVLPTSPNPMVTPLIKNWISTLHGFLYIWNEVRDEAGFRFLSPRGFNQDPIENFFSNVRSYGVTNTHPTCSSFVSCFKALIVNNLMSPHSAGSNCEDGECVGALDNLKSLISTKCQPTDSSAVTVPSYAPSQGLQEIEDISHDLATPYVAGVVLKKLFKHISCNICKGILLESNAGAANILIRAKQYQGCALLHPSSSFIQALRDITNKIYKIMPHIINKYGILKSKDLRHLFCLEHHSSFENFLNITINIVVFRYIKVINNILNRKDLRHKDMDQLTKLAFVRVAYSKKLRK
nr:unnamed protein product [Callosobruchus analis]